MFESLRSIFGSHQLLTGRLSNSSDVSTGSIDVQVGRSVDAQTVHIPQSVLRSYLPLGNRLTPGCRIANADPVIFAVIIEHLECSGMLGTFRFNAPGHLQGLIGGNDALLNFAKAWHVGDMLEMHSLQNKLLGIYRVYYLQCLKDRVRLPLDPEPFVYLRDNIGNHTKAERFIVDFHAGLMQTESSFEPNASSLLPDDIVVNMRDRWQELSGRVRKDSFLPELGSDRIAAGIFNYKVGKIEATLRSTMHVQHLCVKPGPAQFVLNPSLHQRRTTPKHSVSSTLGSRDDCSTSRSRMRERQSSYCASSTQAPNHLGPSRSRESVRKPVLVDPFVKPSSHQGSRTFSRPVSPTEAPSSQQTLAHGYRLSTAMINGLQAPRHQISPAGRISSRAPFMPNNPAKNRRSHEMDDSEVTDEESVYDLFAPDLPWLNAGHIQPPQSSSERVRPDLGILDFAA